MMKAVLPLTLLLSKSTSAEMGPEFEYSSFIAEDAG